MDRLGPVIKTNGTPLLLDERDVLSSVYILSAPLRHVYPEIFDHAGTISPCTGKRTCAASNYQFALKHANIVDASKLPHQENSYAK